MFGRPDELLARSPELIALQTGRRNSSEWSQAKGRFILQRRVFGSLVFCVACV
jgi:hypothetical protein